MDGGTLAALDKLTQIVTITAGDEKRVDWRVKVQNEGDAIVRMKALTDEDSDAMEMRFPVFVHGMLKTESFTGVIPANGKTRWIAATVTVNVPAERRVNQTVLEVRYSPTLAGAHDRRPALHGGLSLRHARSDAEPLPADRRSRTRLLQNMKLDLKEIQKHQTNLNSQEIGKDKERIKKGWELVRQGWRPRPHQPGLR